MDTSLVERLARLRGVGDAYRDQRGEMRQFSVATKTGILRAMGCSVDDPAGLAAEIGRIETERSRRLLPALNAVRGNRAAVDINLTADLLGASLSWNLHLENGTRHSGVASSADCPEIWRGTVEGTWIVRRRLELPLELAPGYHEFEASLAGGPASRCLLIVSPNQCHEPQIIAAGGRLWGVAVQLYTIRSRANWGIGDFDDLKSLVRWLAPRGAGFIGLNPLHALAPTEPEHASPYSASNRHFLNVLYIAVPAVPEYAGCRVAQKKVGDPQFVQRLDAMRAADHVDYAGVARAKLEILDCLHRHFRSRHLARNSRRAARFRAYVAERGDMLQMHARFDALDRHFRETLGSGSGWMSWPPEYRDLNGAAVARFVAEHPLKIEFFAYLQWLAHEQLTEAQALARSLGMPIGLYGDYAVGANASGSETWADRVSYRLEAEIGAPPDQLALKGQGWGIPPQDPLAMEHERLQGFIGLIRDNMRYYGALRLDHVMSLFRLWWVPARQSPTEGAYVHYPLHLLLAVVALESSRSECLVVGEDLGVVPDEMRVAMPQYGLYHYKVMLFEKEGNRFRRPDEFLRAALATVTTHDLPTLRSYWETRDIELRERLHLYPSEEVRAQVLREREHDRTALLVALNDAGLAPPSPKDGREPFTADLAQAMHLYLARSAAALASLQLEDLLGMTDPVNVPGTSQEYPNWRRKMSADLEAIEAREDLRAHLEAVNRARG